MVWFSVMLYKSLSEVAPIPKEYAEIIVMGAFLLCKIASMNIMPTGRTKKEIPAGDSELLEKHFADGISASQSSDLTKQRMQLFYDEYKQEE